MLKFFLTLIIWWQVCLFADLPLYWWQPADGSLNFGDELSRVVVEKIIEREPLKAEEGEKKLLAVGSIIQFAEEGDVVWGSGINGKHPHHEDYSFLYLDVRMLRGPLTRKFLLVMGVDVPEVYGDPALLLPLLFPEFEPRPMVDYIVIPHISEITLVEGIDNIVLPTLPWKDVVAKILESRFVISSSLHGLILAEAFGIPARLLRITQNEPLFKYADYYAGTGRNRFDYAESIEEALIVGGEPPPCFDAEAMLKAFPIDYFFE